MKLWTLLCSFGLLSLLPNADANDIPIPLENSSFRSQTAGWTLLRCAFVPASKAGRDCVLLPSKPNGEYSRLSQAICLPNDLASLRIDATYKTARQADSAPQAQGGKRLEPRIFIQYMDDSGKFLWPPGKNGISQKFLPSQDWTTQSFALERPEGATTANIIIDALNTQNAVSVCEVKATYASAQAKSAAKQDGAPPANLLAGLSSGFEVGSAGWQHIASPHWPETSMPFEWDTANPGEGKRSVLIKPGYGIASFPFFPKERQDCAISFLAKLSSGKGKVSIAGFANKPKWLAWWFGKSLDVDDTWKRVSFTVKAPLNTSSGVSILIKNENKEQDALLSIDAICVSEGASQQYVAPPYELALDTGVFGNYALSNSAPLKAKARLLLRNGAKPEDGLWTWTVKDAIHNDRTISTEPARWTQVEEGLYEAENEVPREQGLYRIFLMEKGRRTPEPMNELMAARIGFEGLPEIGPDPNAAFLGAHYQNQMLPTDSYPYAKEMVSDIGRVFSLYHQAGARWVRLLTGRISMTYMKTVLRSENEQVFFKDEVEQMKAAGLEPLGVLGPGFHENGEKGGWIKTRSSKGGDWASAELPSDMKLWEKYVNAVLSGYKGLIDTWEIFNEPNGVMKVEEYLPLLSSSIACAKETAPTARLLGVCISSDFGAGMDGFLSACLKSKESEPLGIISLHPYTSGAPEEGCVRAYQCATEQRNRFAPGRELWVSEMGWVTLASYESLRARVKRLTEPALSPARGAAYVARNMILAKKFGIAKYFNYACVPLSPNHPYTYSPFFEHDGTPNGVFIQSGVAARLLDQAAYAGECQLAPQATACAFKQKNGSILVCAWNTRPEDSSTYLLFPASKPCAVWNAAGKKMDPENEACQIGIAPVYMQWDKADAAEVKSMLLKSKTAIERIRTLRARFSSEPAPSIDLVASNISETPAALEWLADGAAPSEIEVKEGKEALIARLDLAGSKKQPLSGQAVYDGVAKDVSIFNSYLEAGTAPEKFKADGNLDEWSGEAWTPMKLAANAKSFDAKSSAPPSFKISCAREGLLVALRAPKAKRSLAQTKLGAGQWQMDSVEIYIRAAIDSVDWLDSQSQPGDAKFSVAQSSEEHSQKMLNVAYSKITGFNPDSIQYAFANFKEGAGFQCEILIPWSAIQIPDGTAFVGFDMGVNLSEEGETHSAQYVWSGDSENWHDARHFGVVKLDGSLAGRQ